MNNCKPLVQYSAIAVLQAVRKCAFLYATPDFPVANKFLNFIFDVLDIFEHIGSQTGGTRTIVKIN